MAKVSKTILGEIKGTLGDFVFRTMKGKTFVSLRPQKYKKTKSKALENIRTGFSMLSSFCSCVNSISELTKVWALKQVSGNRTYNKIYSHNNPFIKDYSNYSILKILPQIFGILRYSDRE